MVTNQLGSLWLKFKTWRTDSISRLRMDIFSPTNEENAESNSRELQAECLPKSSRSSVASKQGDNDGVLSDERLESLLLERTDHLSRFQLGQFYFEREMYEKAFVEFEKLKDRDMQALYQLGVMYYDGLGVQEDGVRFCQDILLLLRIHI